MKRPSIKLSQFQRESDEWKRLLAFIAEENAFLKTRLAEVIRDDGIDVDFLNAAEQYQNKFMQKDEIMSLLRKDISQLDKLLSRQVFEGTSTRELVRRQKTLRREIKKLFIVFQQLKFHFNNYLTEHL